MGHCTLTGGFAPRDTPGMNTSPAALPADRVRPATKSDIVPWLPTILSSFAIVCAGVAFIAMVLAIFTAWGDNEGGGYLLIMYIAVCAWAALMIGAVTTMVIALARGSRLTLIGLMPMALAASPLCIVVA